MEIPRLAADAAEIHRDLAMPHLVAWFDAAATMPTDTFARSYGIRLAVVGSSRPQAREFDHGLVLGRQAIDILTRLASARALNYLRDFSTRLDPWADEEAVKAFRRRARRELAMTAMSAYHPAAPNF